MKVSIVSVSRVASAPHFGHLQWTKLSLDASGDSEPWSNETSSGSMTGRSFSGTSTSPQCGQLMTGIGAPQ